MSVAVKYDLGTVLALSMTDPTAAIESLHNLALKLSEEVAAIDAAAKSNEEGKANPMSDKFDKDEEGKAAAIAFLREEDGVFDSITAYIGDDMGRTYHILTAVRDLLVKYLTTEVDYFKSTLTVKSAAPSRKGEFKSDFNEVRDLISHVVGMAQHAGFDPSTSEYLTTTDGGKTFKSILPGFRGAKVSDDGSVTGRYAKVYSLAWTIDDEVLEDGWSIAEIVRILWKGADRIGKNAKSLTDILDAQCADWMKTDFTSESFEVGEHTVTVSRTTTED